MKVGEWVRKQRELKGWTQQKLHDKCGYAPQYISKIERGKSIPSARCVRGFEATFGEKFEEA